MYIYFSISYQKKLYFTTTILRKSIDKTQLMRYTYIKAIAKTPKIQPIMASAIAEL